MAIEQQAQLAKPTWRKIADFPLVAMVIAVALLAGPVWLAGKGIQQVPHWGIPDASRQMIAGLVVVGIVLAVYKLAICKLGEQPRDDLRREHGVRDLALGLGGGALLFSLVTLVAALVGVYKIVGLGDARSILYVLVMFGIIPGVTEELLFRGILFRHLEDFGGSWFALALTSALFGVAHIFNPNATYFSSFAIAVEAGIMLGGAYMLTRSLWAPIGLHASWNFTQGEIFDVPVSGIDGTGLVEARLSGPELLSGGAFGLEASVIALVIATAAGVWMVVRAARAGHLVRPWWVRRKLASQKAVGVDVDRDADLGPPLNPA
ncbi:CPBP family intramembrane glutamic endopeptidase [Sphingomonas sp.]|uniref:CPBP family intramembrane glutamic endopeptidase n=1 Tax=Sphingomonas sp. TaxID=28214 RepID=UPI00286BB68C|nr:CPBP family intramembrane glutamic endopeptidase [Sphingomonas sp.]